MSSPRRAGSPLWDDKDWKGKDLKEKNPKDKAKDIKEKGYKDKEFKDKLKDKEPKEKIKEAKEKDGKDKEKEKFKQKDKDKYKEKDKDKYKVKDKDKYKGKDSKEKDKNKDAKEHKDAKDGKLGKENKEKMEKEEKGKEKMEKIFKDEKRKGTAAHNRSKRAGLVFPVARVARELKFLVPAKCRVQATASVYLAAIMEYVMAELLEVAGNQAKQHGKKRINPRHILVAIKSDEELNELIKATISEGGVVPDARVGQALLDNKKKSVRVATGVATDGAQNLAVFEDNDGAPAPKRQKVTSANFDGSEAATPASSTLFPVSVSGANVANGAKIPNELRKPMHGFSEPIAPNHLFNAVSNPHFGMMSNFHMLHGAGASSSPFSNSISLMGVNFPTPLPGGNLNFNAAMPGLNAPLDEAEMKKKKKVAKGKKAVMH